MTQVFIQSRRRQGSKASKRLFGAHKFQIIIRNDPKDIENLVKHLPVLRCDADPTVDPLALFKLKDDWRKFYGFRSCTEYY
jgi:hypothetical protein